MIAALALLAQTLSPGAQSALTLSTYVGSGVSKLTDFRFLPDGRVVVTLQTGEVMLRKTDGSLFDATERRRITPGELRDYVRDGGLFEARRQENGSDCTYEVLQGVLGLGLLENLVPGLGGGSLPGLGGLSALAGGGPLAGLGGAAGLGDLARLVGDRVARNGDDWDEPRRRSHSRPSGEWGRDDDWGEGRSRREGVLGVGRG